MKDECLSLEPVCPEFSISNSGFSIEEPISYIDDEYCYLIDGSIASVSQSDITDLVRDYSFSSVLILGKDSFGFYTNGRAVAYKYKDLPSFSVTKESLFSHIIPLFVTLFFIGVILFRLFYVGFYYLAALVMSLFTYLVCAIYKKDKEIIDRDRFLITVLAKFPIFLVVLIINNLVPGVKIKMGWAALLVIAYTVLIVALYDKNETTEKDDTVNTVNIFEDSQL